jgi:hypothetical protein
MRAHGFSIELAGRAGALRARHGHGSARAGWPRHVGGRHAADHLGGTQDAREDEAMTKRRSTRIATRAKAKRCAPAARPRTFEEVRAANLTDAFHAARVARLNMGERFDDGRLRVLREI